MWNIFSYCSLFQFFETESLTELKHITQLVGEPRDPLVSISQTAGRLGLAIHECWRSELRFSACDKHCTD